MIIQKLLQLCVLLLLPRGVPRGSAEDLHICTEVAPPVTFPSLLAASETLPWLPAVWDQKPDARAARPLLQWQQSFDVLFLFRQDSFELLAFLLQLLEGTKQGIRAVGCRSAASASGTSSRSPTSISEKSLLCSRFTYSTSDRKLPPPGKTTSPTHGRLGAPTTPTRGTSTGRTETCILGRQTSLSCF